MATWVTSWASSQSRKAKTSAAVVPKVRTCCSRAPFDAGTRTQAATVCLCTSSPHTRSISRSMVPPPRVVSPVPGGASFARLCSACSMATMRGADSSHVRLFADSRYQLQSTFPGIRRAVSIDDFHDARVCPRPMAIICGLLRKSRWQPSRSRRPFERHAIPLALQQLDSPPSDSFPMPAIEVVGTEFLIRGLSRQDMIRGDQHGVGDREDGLLVTAVAHDAAVAGRERTVGRPNRRQRGFGERRPQPAIAAPRLPRLVLPGAFVVPGTEAGPAGQVAGPWGTTPNR